MKKLVISVFINVITYSIKPFLKTTTCSLAGRLLLRRYGKCHVRDTTRWTRWLSNCSKVTLIKWLFSANLVLFSANSIKLLFSANWWSPGVRCWNECKPGYAGWNFGNYTTCVCDDTACKFDAKNFALCVEAACDTDIESIASEWQKGFDDSLHRDDFSPDTAQLGPLEACFPNLFKNQFFLNNVFNSLWKTWIIVWWRRLMGFWRWSVWYR